MQDDHLVDTDTQKRKLAVEIARSTAMDPDEVERQIDNVIASPTLTRDDIQMLVAPSRLGRGNCIKCGAPMADKRGEGTCSDCLHRAKVASAVELPDGRMVVQSPKAASRAARRAVGRLNSPNTKKARRAARELAKFQARYGNQA